MPWIVFSTAHSSCSPKDRLLVPQQSQRETQHSPASMESGSHGGGGRVLPSARSYPPAQTGTVKSSGRDEQKETGRGLTLVLLTGGRER